MNRKKILVIGHRGACGYEPENTLRSFEKAVELKVDMVELDAQLCKSGEPVVFHDRRLERTTNGKGYLRDKNFDELRLLDAGKGEKIPSLREALDLINKRAMVNIELKGSNCAPQVFGIIEDFVNAKQWSYDNFIISSFNHIELQKFNRLNKGIKIGALFCGIPLGYARPAQKLNAYSVHLNVEFATMEFIKDAHRRAIKAFVYTVNEPDEIEKMKLMEVDGIFSNFPDRIQNAIL